MKPEEKNWRDIYEFDCPVVRKSLQAIRNATLIL